MLIFKLSILFALGVILSTIMNKVKIPDVLAYITTGIVLGPSLLNLFTYDDLASLNMINQFAICLVGFLISKSLHVKTMRIKHFSVLLVSIIESIVTFTIVYTVCRFFCGQSAAVSLLLAAISSATAPIIPLMVLRQFKAEGNLTSAIVPVIAIDDIICIILFYTALALAQADIGKGTFGALFLDYAFMFFLTLLMGLILGLASSLLMNVLLKKKDERLIFSVGICFGCVGIAQILRLQPTVLSMVIGFVIANCTREYDKVFDGLYRFAPPVFLAFFVATSSIIAVDIYNIVNIGLLGVAYILSRTAGKLAGCYIGTKICKYGAVTKKYLGLSILAQAGIILTMADIVNAELPGIGAQIDVIVRGGCVLFLTVGPILTKFSIGKANEIHIEQKVGG